MGEGRSSEEKKRERNEISRESGQQGEEWRGKKGGMKKNTRGQRLNIFGKRRGTNNCIIGILLRATSHQQSELIQVSLLGSADAVMIPVLWNQQWGTVRWNQLESCLWCWFTQRSWACHFKSQASVFPSQSGENKWNGTYESNLKNRVWHKQTQSWIYHRTGSISLKSKQASVCLQLSCSQAWESFLPCVFKRSKHTLIPSSHCIIKLKWTHSKSWI